MLSSTDHICFDHCWRLKTGLEDALVVPFRFQLSLDLSASATPSLSSILPDLIPSCPSYYSYSYPYTLTRGEAGDTDNETKLDFSTTSSSLSIHASTAARSLGLRSKPLPLIPNRVVSTPCLSVAVWDIEHLVTVLSYLPSIDTPSSSSSCSWPNETRFIPISHNALATADHAVNLCEGIWIEKRETSVKEWYECGSRGRGGCGSA